MKASILGVDGGAKERCVKVKISILPFHTMATIWRGVLAVPGSSEHAFCMAYAIMALVPLIFSIWASTPKLARIGLLCLIRIALCMGLLILSTHVCLCMIHPNADVMGHFVSGHHLTQNV